MRRDEVGVMVSKGLAEGIGDGRAEVQKVMDNINEQLLESEKIYNSEKERLNSESNKNIDENQKKANEKYLQGLKETAEKERKI